MSYFDSSDISTVQDEEDVILEVLNYLMIDAFLHALHFFFSLDFIGKRIASSFDRYGVFRLYLNSKN